MMYWFLGCWFLVGDYPRLGGVKRGEKLALGKDGLVDWFELLTGGGPVGGRVVAESPDCAGSKPAIYDI